MKARKMMSLMVLICMCIGLIPTGVLAKERDNDVQARYQTEADGAWREASLDEALANVYAGGRVEILQNIELAHHLTITKNLTLTSKDVTHPAVLRYQPKDRNDCLLEIGSGQAVLADIVLDGGSAEGAFSHAELVMVKNGARLVMEGGAIIQNNNNIDTALGSGGLRVINGSLVTMNEGAVIQNCQALAGGGAAISGNGTQLVLNGGRITACRAFVGGGVFIQERGILRLNEGVIEQNEAKKEIPGLSYGSFNYAKGQGGGVYVASGYMYMLGGSVQKNHAESSGGGIGVNAGVLQLAGGSIRYNTAHSYGGGVMGSPDANILVGMEPVISDNISDEKYFHNLHLDGVEDDDPLYATRAMIVGAALSQNAEINVARWTRPDETHPYRIIAVPSANYMISEEDLAKFHSDDPAYVVRMIDGNIVLTTAPPHVHEWATAWSHDETAHWHECIVSDCPLDDPTLKDGYALHQEDEGTITIPATTEAPGLIVYRCSDCHEIIRTKEIPQLSHVHEWATKWSYDETAHWHECIVSDCPLDGPTLKDGYALHREDAGTVTIPATTEASGLITYRCTDCHEIIRTEIIPQLKEEEKPYEAEEIIIPPKSDQKVPSDPTPDQMQSTPNTGDMHTNPYTVACLLSLMITVFAVNEIKKKTSAKE